jgi:quinohemoprotein ethanol dehydrogenase
MKKAAETWSGDWWKLGGGGSVWDGMAYDPETDLFYVGTGNGGPWPEELRKSKGKDNLYVCSILAIKPETGKLAWYFQNVPGDSWDFDSVQQLLLADLTIKGKPRKVIMQANKDGFYYVIDRVTGQFISGQPFSEVTWAKGLDESTGRPIVNPEARYGSEVITIAPGPGGAHNWAPMSFNPTTGLVYIPTSTFSSMNYSVDQNFTFKAGRSNTGVAGMGGGGRGGQNTPAADAKKPPSPPAIGPIPAAGERRALIAWDPVTQRERWRAPQGGSIGGGTLTTAGNLVFQVSPDGHLFAYTADRGEKLLDVDTGLVGGMGPPMTYQLDGKQYVALMGGTGRVLPRDPAPAGPAAPPAEPANPNAAAPPPDLATGPAASATPPHLPKLLTYVLDGKAN